MKTTAENTGLNTLVSTITAVRAADWEAFSPVSSGNVLPDEAHAVEDDWDEFEAVNDPASGKVLPNEGHAVDDDWDDFEAVNDPASGKVLPNEGHAVKGRNKCRLVPARFLGGGLSASSKPLAPTIYATQTYERDIRRIYGGFTSKDDEFPAMGITIQGAPVFVECVCFPDCAVIRRPTTDEVQRSHPAVGELWRRKLEQYKGRCRTSTVHIHPMNFPSLSSTDIANFDSLRLNPDDASTFSPDHPYPVILVNLRSANSLDLLAFWVFEGSARRAELRIVADDDEVISAAWSKAEPMPYFSDEAQFVNLVDRLVSKEWLVELGVNSTTGDKAIKARRSDGKCALVRFDPESPTGLNVSNTPEGFSVAQFIDWTRLFNTLADAQSCIRNAEMKPQTEEAAAAPSAVDDSNAKPKQPCADDKSPTRLMPRYQAVL